MTVEEFERIRGEVCPLCLHPRGEDGGCSRCGWTGDVVRTRPNCLSPGSILRDRYLVGQPLGQGGFSITYLVLDLSLNLRLCLKEFFPSSAVSRISGGQGVRVIDGQMEEAFREGLDQFLLEGRILARLSGKPGIIEVRDLFQMNGTAYMVMDLLEGVTLRNYLGGKKEKLPPEQVLKILMPIMDSLRAVHEEGIVHRDISPENVFLTTDGQARLLDFGSARDLPLRVVEGRSIVVKPGYAAPEQYRARGRQGAWTDVYGLSATFFRCVTGTPPPDALDRIEEDPLQSLSDEEFSLPVKWKKVLLRGMAVQVGDRFQDVSSLQFALLHAAGLDGELTSRGEKRKGSLLKVFVIGVSLVAAVVSGGLWHLNDRPGKLMEKADRLIESGQYPEALELLGKAESRILAEPGAREVLLLCQNYFDARSGEKSLALVLRFPDYFRATPEGLACAAHVLDATGRGEKALEYISLAAQQAPEREDYWLLQGKISLSLGDREAALEAYGQAAGVVPSDPIPRLESARILSELSRLGQSEEMYIQALNLVPEDGGAWEELALLREEQGRTLEAARAWERVVLFMPDRWSPWVHLGRAMEAVGDFSAAAKAFSEAARLTPENAEVWAELGLVLARTDAPKEAFEALTRAIELEPGRDSIRLVSQRGLMALRIGKTDSGLIDLEWVLAEDPSRQDLWKILARTYESLGNYPDAAKAWERALPHLDDRGETQAARGKDLLLSGKPALAEGTFRQALSLLGGEPDVLLGLATALLKQSRPGEAIPYIREALDEEGDLPAANALLGEALLEEGGYAEAVLHLIEARRLGDRGTGLLMNLGRGYLGLEQYERAVAYFRKVLGEEPENVGAIRLLEETFYRWGQHSGAVEAYGEMVLEEAAEVQTEVGGLDVVLRATDPGNMGPKDVATGDLGPEPEVEQ